MHLVAELDLSYLNQALCPPRHACFSIVFAPWAVVGHFSQSSGTVHVSAPHKLCSSICSLKLMPNIPCLVSVCLGLARLYTNLWVLWSSFCLWRSISSLWNMPVRLPSTAIVPINCCPFHKLMNVSFGPLVGPLLPFACLSCESFFRSFRAWKYCCALKGKRVLSMVRQPLNSCLLVELSAHFFWELSVELLTNLILSHWA